MSYIQQPDRFHYITVELRELSGETLLSSGVAEAITVIISLCSSEDSSMQIRPMFQVHCIASLSC